MPHTHWTFAGDEAGDVSFRFSRGATRHFVVAIIGTQQPEAWRAALADLRRRHNLPAGYEFGFHRTTARRLRAALFETVGGLDFRAWAVVVDKTKLSGSFRIMPSRLFYVYAVTRSVESIPLHWRENATLLLDEFDRSGKTLAELKRALKLLDIQRGFKRIRSRRSHSDALIQIADSIAGAVLCLYSKQDDRAYRRFESKFEVLRQIEE